jgi:hypothetical protein
MDRGRFSPVRAPGVAISRLVLDRREVSLEGPVLAAGWRWTVGDGLLALADARELAFVVAISGSYWRDRKRSEPRAA